MMCRDCSLFPGGFEFLSEHSGCEFTDRVRHFFVALKVSKIRGEEVFDQPKRNIDRCARIERKVSQYGVLLYETPLHRNAAKNGLEHILLIGKLFDLAVGNLWRLKHGERDHFRAVTNE